MTSVAAQDVTYVDVTQNPAFVPGPGEPLDNYLVSTFNQQQQARRAAVTVGFETDGVVRLNTNAAPNSLRAKGWFDSRHQHALPTVLSIMNNALLRQTAGSNYSITTVNHPLPRSLDEKITNYLQSGTDLLVAINVIIALSFVPASFVLYLVNERMSKSKHLQFVSGVTPPVYWLSTFSW
jgi:hypothetical protein